MSHRFCRHQLLAYGHRPTFIQQPSGRRHSFRLTLATLLLHLQTHLLLSYTISLTYPHLRQLDICNPIPSRTTFHLPTDFFPLTSTTTMSQDPRALVQKVRFICFHPAISSASAQFPNSAAPLPFYRRPSFNLCLAIYRPRKRLLAQAAASVSLAAASKSTEMP